MMLNTDYFYEMNIFHNGVDAKLKTFDAFCQKAQKFVQSRLSDNVQILLACGTNTYNVITSDIQAIDASISNGNMKNPIELEKL